MLTSGEVHAQEEESDHGKNIDPLYWRMHYLSVSKMYYAILLDYRFND